VAGIRCPQPLQNGLASLIQGWLPVDHLRYALAFGDCREPFLEKANIRAQQCRERLTTFGCRLVRHSLLAALASVRGFLPHGQPAGVLRREADIMDAEKNQGSQTMLELSDRNKAIIALCCCVAFLVLPY